MTLLLLLEVTLAPPLTVFVGRRIERAIERRRARA